MNKSKEIATEVCELVRKYFDEQSLYRVKLTGPLSDSTKVTELKGRLILIKGKLHIQYVYRYATKDITKNLQLEEALAILDNNIQEYQNISIQSNDLIHQYNPKKKRLDTTNKSINSIQNLQNDRVKKKAILEDRSFLMQLGISSSKGKVYSDKRSKYRQINKYLELLDPLIEKAKLNEHFTVTDMGCGKGYLTFALYDHLAYNLKESVSIVGIDMREEMMKKNQGIADELNYKNLRFEAATIAEYEHESDMLIALHACDTATDDAIISGIVANSQLIICSPCCHKQVRKDMSSTSNTKSIVEYGILEERLAEILTDAIRSLILEAFGYKTQVMEFISTAHTPKNLLITAIKSKNPRDRKQCIEEIQLIKKQYGISNHYLERVFST